MIKYNRQYCIKVKLENQHALDQEYRGFHEAIQQIFPPWDKPRNYLGGLSFLFGQTAALLDYHVGIDILYADYEPDACDNNILKLKPVALSVWAYFLQLSQKEI